MKAALGGVKLLRKRASQTSRVRSGGGGVGLWFGHRVVLRPVGSVCVVSCAPFPDVVSLCVPRV